MGSHPYISLVRGKTRRAGNYFMVLWKYISNCHGIVNRCYQLTLSRRDFAVGLEILSLHYYSQSSSSIRGPERQSVFCFPHLSLWKLLLSFPYLNIPYSFPPMTEYFHFHLVFTLNEESDNWEIFPIGNMMLPLQQWKPFCFSNYREMVQVSENNHNSHT